MSLTLRESGLLVDVVDVPEGAAAFERRYDDALEVRYHLRPIRPAERYDWQASYGDKGLTHVATLRNDPAIDWGRYRVLLGRGRGHRQPAVYDILSMQESSCGRYLTLSLHERRAGNKAVIDMDRRGRMREKYGY